MKTSICLNKKILVLMLVIILLFTIIPIKSNASELDTVAQGANGFIEKGKSTGGPTMDPIGVKSASDTIYNLLLGIGILLVLAVGSILGIRFMMASAEDKAKLKEALIPYIVGSIIIFGAFGIWKIAILIGGNFN